jgi:hypothetical protein
VNQLLSVVLAFAFLLGIGIFNLAAGIGNLRKRNRSKWVGILRLLLALVLFLLAFWLQRRLYGSSPK